MRELISKVFFGSIKNKFFIFFFIVIFISISSVGYYGFNSASKAYFDSALEADKEDIEEISDVMSGFLDTVPKDLKFINGFYALNKYLYWREIGEKEKVKEWHKVMTDAFSSFIDAKRLYYKIRFIDKDGVENIKILFNKNSNETVITPRNRLQNKRDAEYFQEPIKLKRDEIYVSNINLNREYGKIELPYIPVLRYAMPVIDDNGGKYGVLVMNIYADSFLKFIDKVMKKRKKDNYNIILTDKDGNYLFHKDKEKLWGADLNHGENLEKDYPNLFREAKENESGTIVNERGVLNFMRVYPLESNKDNYWIILNHTDKDEALSKVQNFKYIFTLITIVILIIVTISLKYLMDKLVAPLVAITNQLRILSSGQISTDTITYNGNDEIQEMVISINQLTKSFEKTINQANSIASGDYEAEVKLLSNKDELNKALNHMTKTLKQNEKLNSEQNWIKDGLTSLSTNISGDLSLEELSKRAISFLAKYIEAGQGVLYTHDFRDKLLKLKASYAFNERSSLSNSYKIGEGIIGQVALEREPILLSDINSSKVSITTGLIEERAVNSITFPLIYEGELYGVIELASFKPFNQLKQQFLDEAEKIISTYIYTSIKNDEIKVLLKLSEEATKEAQRRSEEIQQANVQMEEQQQQLTQQSEELQQVNAQLEEQQQQLTQQSEELSRKNESLIKTQKEINQRAKELEQSNRYKSEFLANMSHELRTPLNSIILLSKMLTNNDDGNLKDDDIKKSRVIHDAGNELLRLINDILDLSKIEAGRMNLNLEHISTKIISEEMEDLFSLSAKDKGIEFLIDDELNDEIVTDKDKLSQVLRNFLSNSFKFTKDGSITLKFEECQYETLPIKISVIDTGIGIPKEKQNIIFEAFKQVDGSITREYGGTGLGLSIAREYVKLLGGKIELKSNHGDGSQFIICLPKELDIETNDKLEVNSKKREVKPKIDKKVKEKAKKSRKNLIIDAKHRNLLIVEDDEFFAGVVESEAKKDNFNIFKANSGKEALEIVSSQKISAIVLDLGLPDMDGVEFLRELKSTKEFSKIPVYIMSARDRDEKLIKSNVIGYLQKPVNEIDIDEALKDLIEKNSLSKILIVEDNEVERETVSEFLTKKLSVECSGVSSANNAIKEIKKDIYDVIILDLGLEKSSGYEVCQYVKDNKLELPIIIYTSKDLSLEEEEELKKYSQSIIVKTERSSERMIEELQNFLSTPTKSIEDIYIKGENKGDIANLKDKKILVVDDDARNIFVLSSALERHGAKVIDALNGKKALEKLKSEIVDLILMDIMMPEMDGYDTMRAIRKDEKLKSIPIIALTAKALKEDREKCIEAGANDYLSKPVDYDSLLHLSSAWIDKKS